MDKFEELTENQKLLLQKALYRLRFIKSDILSNYINSLFCKWNKIQERKYRSKDKTHDLVYNSIINEYNFRKNIPDDDIDYPFSQIQQFVNKDIELFCVRASDIAQYVFCPVSYAIKKSFIDRPIFYSSIEESAAIAKKFHEQNRLASYVGKHYYINEAIYFNDQPTNSANLFLADLRESVLTYVGHSESNNEKKYFKSTKGNFVGQPDYVLTNKDGQNYIVEEKFKWGNRISSYFHPNHRAQLLAYLYGLDTINAQYGYLIYWYYDKKEISIGYRQTEKRSYVVGYHIIRVDRSEESPNLLKHTYIQIIKLNSKEHQHFDTNNLNSDKCSSCVVSKFCGHKTGTIDYLTIPYTENFYQLKSYTQR